MTTPTDEEAIERIAGLLLVKLGDIAEQNVPVMLAATKHSGDCTKDAWTCSKCYADEHRDAARAAWTEAQAIMRERREKERGAMVPLKPEAQS